MSRSARRGLVIVAAMVAAFGLMLLGFQRPPWFFVGLVFGIIFRDLQERTP